jgi:four helix bundle protein
MDEEKKKKADEFKKRLYNFTLKLIELIEKLPKDNVSRRIGDQLLRSGTSIIANYIEGKAASSKKDFANFINISLKSSNESKLWLSLLKDTGKIDAEKTVWFLNELKEVSNIFGASLITMRNKRV